LVDEVRADGVVSIANHNAEFQIVITGAPEPVEKVSALSAAQGAKAIPLKVSGAWHSELIKGAEEAFTECLDSVSFDSPQSAVVFNVTGEFETDPDEIKSIMAKQLGSPVRWYDSMRKMMEEDVEVFAEVGPGKVLTGLLKKTLTGDAPTDIHSVNNMKALEMFIKAAT
jgi:[acyl-carrier-protein] S-malonyltransferase